MSGFEVLGLMSSIQTIIVGIDQVVGFIQNYRDFDDDVQQLSLHFEADARTLKRFSSVLADLSHAAQGLNLSDEDYRLHSDIEAHLGLLEKRLRSRVNKLVHTPTPGLSEIASFGSKSAWALWRKRDLERLEISLKDWLSRVHVFYSAIDAEINVRKAALPGRSTSEDRARNVLELFTRLSLRPVNTDELLVPISDLRIAGESSRRMCADYGKDQQSAPVIVEYISKAYSPNLTDEEINEIGNGVLELAKILHHSDPSQTCILKCCGYFHETQTCRFGLIYEIPASLGWYEDATGQRKVLSLRELFNRVPRFSLSHRLRFACDLAKAVLYVHLVGWVHKSIRPENILLLEDPSSGKSRRFPYTLSNPFLAGFEYARNVKTASNRRSDIEWHLNIYRHPKRQFLERNSEYTMAHDIYSLGVVFLELGLWGSNGFIPFQKRQELFKNKSGEQFKEVLTRLANGVQEPTSKEKGVAVMMGNGYTELVLLCLNIEEKQEVPTASFIQEIWLRLDEMRSALG